MGYKDKNKQKEASKKHYAEHKDKYIERNRNRKAECREWLDSLKKDIPCSICGNSYPPKAMDWHHRDRKEKAFAISNAVNLGYGKERIKKEIAKCDIVCAVCHRLIES